jgi:broad specificity phosphatase PhoE
MRYTDYEDIKQETTLKPRKISNESIHDPGLTARGCFEATQIEGHLREWVPQLHIYKIICSPSRRALQTMLLATDDIRTIGLKAIDGSRQEVPILVDANWQNISDRPCDTCSDIETLRNEFRELDFSELPHIYPQKIDHLDQFKLSVQKRGINCMKQLKSHDPEEFGAILVFSHGDFLEVAITGKTIAQGDYRIYQWYEDSFDDCVGGSLYEVPWTEYQHHKHHKLGGARQLSQQDSCGYESYNFQLEDTRGIRQRYIWSRQIQQELLEERRHLLERRRVLSLAEHHKLQDIHGNIVKEVIIPEGVTIPIPGIDGETSDTDKSTSIALKAGFRQTMLVPPHLYGRRYINPVRTKTLAELRVERDAELAMSRAYLDWRSAVDNIKRRREAAHFDPKVGVQGGLLPRFDRFLENEEQLFTLLDGTEIDHWGDHMPILPTPPPGSPVFGMSSVPEMVPDIDELSNV